MYQAAIATTVLCNKQAQTQWHNTVSINFHTHAHRSAGQLEELCSRSSHISGTRASFSHDNGSSPTICVGTYNGSEVPGSFMHSVTFAPTPLASHAQRHFCPYPAGQSQHSRVGKILHLCERSYTHITKGTETRKGE